MPLSLLQMQNGRKAFGGQPLFEQAVFAVNEGEHVGVIGPNGAGKTTLFRILNEEESLDEGQVIRSQALSLGYLSQHDHWHADETGNSFLERTSKLPLWQVKSMGRDLQVSEDIFEKPILSLSGGYRMRIKLIGLLGQDPNMMLLDEPTNYLDLETTLLLERFLQNYQGAFLLISHDREFLRRTTDHILEIESGEITKYNGNIDDYFEQKALLRAQLEAQAQNQAEKRKTVLDFVSRFGAKATKAKQAQSRLRALEKMETVELKPLPITAKIHIPPPAHVGKSVLKIEKAEFSYPEKKVLKNVSVEIKRGDHVAVVGLNGAGKSTLLKGLAGSLAPTAGVRELGYQVKLAIFNQHVIEVLNPQKTVLESLQEVAAYDLPRQTILNMAGSLLFSDDHIQKKIAVLSGGEKSRVALGRILLQKASCLLLDEPTNHLDFQTVEALTQALNDYEGTFVVVSHDRGFIRRVANRILEVSQGDVHLYPGSYDEYVWSLQKGLQASADELAYAGVSRQESRGQTPVDNHAASGANAWANKKDREKKLRLLEKKITQCEDEIKKLEAENLELNEQIMNASGSTQPLVQKLSENALRLQDLETQWLDFAAERDALN